MDHSPDRLLVDHTGTLTPACAFLHLLGMVKGLTPTATTLADASLSPAIVHRGVQIQGFWPAVHYLMDVRPYPELLPSSAARRGVVASLTELVLTDASYLAQVAPLYAQGPRATPHHTTLLDLAVAAYRNTTLEPVYPWIIQVAVHLHEYIDSLQEAA